MILNDAQEEEYSSRPTFSKISFRSIVENPPRHVLVNVWLHNMPKIIDSDLLPKPFECIFDFEKKTCKGEITSTSKNILALIF